MTNIYTLDAVVATNDEYMPRDYRTVAICTDIEKAKQIVAPFYAPKRLLWVQDAGGHAALCTPIWKLNEETIIGWSIFEVEADSMITELTMAGEERQRQ